MKSTREHYAVLKLVDSYLIITTILSQMSYSLFLAHHGVCVCVYMSTSILRDSDLFSLDNFTSLTIRSVHHNNAVKLLIANNIQQPKIAQ